MIKQHANTFKFNDKCIFKSLILAQFGLKSLTSKTLIASIQYSYNKIFLFYRTLKYSKMDSVPPIVSNTS